MTEIVLFWHNPHIESSINTSSISILYTLEIFNIHFFPTKPSNDVWLANTSLDMFWERFTNVNKNKSIFT